MPRIGQEVKPTCDNRWDLHENCVWWVHPIAQCSKQEICAWPQQGLCDLGHQEGCGDLWHPLSTLYSHNKEVASGMRPFGFLHSIPTITKHNVCWILQDTEWIDSVYCPLITPGLQAAHRYINNTLKALKFPFLNQIVSPYVRINLKKYRNLSIFEEELILYHSFLYKYLILSSDKSGICEEPGWLHLIVLDIHLCLKVTMHVISGTRGAQAVSDK